MSSGLVASLNKPGANVTGVTFIFAQLAAKRLQLFRQLLPNASTIAMVVNPKFQLTAGEVGDMQAAARSIGLKINVLNASTEQEIDAAFTTITQQKVDALMFGTDPFLIGQRDQLARLATRYTVPKFFVTREFVEAGGLMSYGPNIANGYRQAGTYTGRILSGAKPSELPVLQPTSIPLFINLKTAKALGLTIPANLLAIADEVIE